MCGDREKVREKEREKDREIARKRKKEGRNKRDGAYTQEKERRRGLVYKRREVGEREGKEPGGGTPENGLAQLRRLAGGESAG